MYEHGDLVDDSYPKPASEATPSYKYTEAAPSIIPSQEAWKEGVKAAIERHNDYQDNMNKLRRIIGKDKPK